jgi:hypothetical protein
MAPLFIKRSKRVYDPKTNSWTVLEPMPSKRGGLALRQLAKRYMSLEGKSLPEHLIAMKAMILQLTNGVRDQQCQRLDTAWSLLQMMIEYILLEEVRIQEGQGAVRTRYFLFVDN